MSTPAVEKNFETFKPGNNLPQELAYDSEAAFLLLKGGQRSGKSVVIINKAIKHGLLVPGIKFLITRKVWKHLYDTNYNDFMTWCPARAINKKRSWKSTTDAGIAFNNGTTYEFRAYSDEDIQNVRGHEYGVIIMSEANQLTEHIFEMLLGRLSQSIGKAYNDFGEEYQSVIPTQARRFWIDTNPGGHDWIWRRFDRNNPDCYDIKNQDGKFFAVRFRMEDNKDNLPEGYIAMQKEMLSKRMWDRYGEGIDEPFTGLVFDNFDRRVHIMHGLSGNGFVPPAHWPVWVGLDYGKRTNTHACWITVTEDKQYIVFKEYVDRGRDAQTIADNIKLITSQLEMKGMGHPTAVVVDPSTDASKGEAKLTIYEQLRQAGITNLRKGKRETGELAGVMMIQGLLQPRPGRPHPVSDLVNPKGWPALYFCEDCPQVIQEFEEWRYQEEKSELKDPREKPEERNDHGIDSCRYAIGVAVSAAGQDPLTAWMQEHSPKARNLRFQERKLKETQASGWTGRLNHTDLL